MNNAEIALTSKDEFHPLKTAKEMGTQEFSNWWAFCNALKFINYTSERIRKPIQERDIDCRGIINYVEEVGGDIATCIRETAGIPYKYALCSIGKEAEDLRDLDYAYMA